MKNIVKNTTKNQLIESHICGALLGLACGDALGAPAEFHNQEFVKATWGVLQDMVGGGPWLPGEWTDDAGMALCIAQGILADPADPIEETGKRFLLWRETAKDVGSTISAALRAYQGDWPAAARSTPQAKQGKAAGNGSLMRTLPVALAYGSNRELMQTFSARLSAMTHWDSEAEMCCLIYCLWINHILNGHTLSSGWQQALCEGQEAAARARKSGFKSRKDTPGVGALPAAFWSRLEAVESLQYDQLQPSGYAGYVVECLEAAAWCCLHSESLEQALVRAVNLAGEADTIGAVAGGVAGAYWGREAIPARWLDKLHQRAELEETAHRLSALRRHAQVYATPGLPPFDFDEVTERVYAGRNPLTARDVETLAAHGITHVLDLREPKEWAAHLFGAEAIEEIEALGLQRLNLMVTDTKRPTAQTLEASCEWIEAALQNGENRVYVHCRAGIERTAAVLVAFTARTQGVSYDEALQMLRKQRSVLAPLPEQEQVVRDWLKSQAAR